MKYTNTLLILLIIIIVFTGNTLALNVKVLNETHSIIHHEIIFEMDSTTDLIDVVKGWDFNLFGLNDKRITNLIYEKQVPETIYSTTYSQVKEYCSLENIGNQIDANIERKDLFFCYNDDPIKNVNAKELYQCQSNIECYTTILVPSQVSRTENRWQPTGTITSTTTINQTTLRIPTVTFPQQTKTIMRVSFDIPITNQQWGSTGNWAMNPSGWWDSIWTKKRQITITNNSTSTLQDHNNSVFLRITNELGTNALANCNDVRIIQGNTIEIDRNIIGNCQNDANIWFNLNTSIAGSGTDNNYYLYYSNSGAGTATNAYNFPLPAVDSNTTTLVHFDYSSLNATRGITPVWAGTPSYQTLNVFGGGSIGTNFNSNYIYYPTNPLPIDNKSWTAETWFYQTDAATNQIFGYTASGANYFNITFNPTDSLSAQLVIGGVNCVAPNLRVSAAKYPLNMWHHVSFTRNRSNNTIYLRLDGNVVSISDACSASNLSISDSGTGYFANGIDLTYTSYYLHGYLDEFRVSTYAKTQFPQVDINASTKQPTTGLGTETNYGADFNITFNVYRSGTSNHLTGITADWNDNTYDVSGQNSPFSQFVLSANYTATFSRIGYDNNTNFLIIADNNKTYTVYLADTTAPSAGTTTTSGFTIYSTFIKGIGAILGDITTDTGSGIDTSSCEYTLNNGGLWSPATWNTNHCEKTGIIISTGTTYTFNTRVRDLAGNLRTKNATITYTGDTLAPTTTMSYTILDNNNTATITLTCTDANSGCTTTKYMFDTNGTWYTATSGVPFTFTGIGHYYIDYNSTDNIGNIEIQNHQDLNMPILLTVKYPKNVQTLVQLTEKWAFLSTGGVILNLTDLNSDRNVYVAPNIVTTFYISDVNGNYTQSTFTRTYYVDSNNGTTDILQPYLYSIATSLATTINVLNKNSLAPIPNITIKFYGNIPGIGNTLIGQGTTDSKGQLLQLFIAGQSYVFNVYNGSTLLETYNYTAVTTQAYIYFNFLVLDSNHISPVTVVSNSDLNLNQFFVFRNTLFNSCTNQNACFPSALIAIVLTIIALIAATGVTATGGAFIGIKGLSIIAFCCFTIFLGIGFLPLFIYAFLGTITLIMAVVVQ